MQFLSVPAFLLLALAIPDQALAAYDCNNIVPSCAGGNVANPPGYHPPCPCPGMIGPCDQWFCGDTHYGVSLTSPCAGNPAHLPLAGKRQDLHAWSETRTNTDGFRCVASLRPTGQWMRLVEIGGTGGKRSILFVRCWETDRLTGTRGQGGTWDSWSKREQRTE